MKRIKRPSLVFVFIILAMTIVLATCDTTTNSDDPVTVESVTLSDDTHFAVTTETLPVSLDAGATTTVTGKYSPTASGSHTATVTVAVDVLSTDLAVTLTGSGNYAPTIVSSGYRVYNDGSSYNGFYFENGTHHGKPAYDRAPDGDFHLFYFDSSYSASFVASEVAGPGDPAWLIDPDIDIADSWDADAYTSDAPAAPEDGTWTGVADISLATGPVIPADNTAFEVGDVLTVHYAYTDAEGDAESGTTFQWYRDSAADGPGTAISGATSQSYTTTLADPGKYLWVLVQPNAETGITPGSAVKSEVFGPITAQVNPPPV